MKHLTKDMVMATLFAESVAREFYIHHKNVKPGVPVSRSPRWVRDRKDRWTTALDEQRKAREREAKLEDVIVGYHPPHA